MAGRGPTPGSGSKPDDQRRRRNAAPTKTIVTADGKTHGPELPEALDEDDDWPEATRAWWETWRTCALAAQFTATDWAFLLDTALLHADFWRGDRSVASELRLRAAKFGATPEDRARLKIEIGDPQSNPAGVSRMKTKAQLARRGRLLKVVGDDNSAD